MNWYSVAWNVEAQSSIAKQDPSEYEGGPYIRVLMSRDSTPLPTVPQLILFEVLIIELKGIELD